MGTITLYLRVTHSQELGIDGTLWHQERTTDFLPTVETPIELWGDSDDGETGAVLWGMKRAYLNADGSWGVDLKAVRVNPNEANLAWLRGPGMKHAQPWWTDQNGDIEKHLRGAGWRRYGQEANHE